MIELRNVHKSFGPVEVLKGITAAVEKSEVVCIIGPSGSGKSTILRCINGLESYDAGAILVDGARVENNAPSIVAIRTQVSMVFQRFNLFPHRTAIENVVEGPIYVKSEPRAEALWERSEVAREGVTCITCHRITEEYAKTNGQRTVQPGTIARAVTTTGKLNSRASHTAATPSG